MNTEAGSTAAASPGSPHLDLEDLLAGVAGEQLGDEAREHLAACGRCRAEASRWDTVAGGVRGLTAAAPDAAPLPPPRPGREAPVTGQAALAGQAALWGRRPRAMLAAGAAAALVLIGGAGYGLTAAFTGPSASPAGAGATAALTTVGGCTGLKEASGTLEQASGTGLVIKTASGQLVTVTASASTHVSLGRAPLTDITDGAFVMVGGRESGETIAAHAVGLGLSPFNGRIVAPPEVATAQGTVADAGPSGFTVVRPDGTRVAVTTSSETNVNLLHASLSQLRTGVSSIAIGRVGPDGTLAATAILQPGVSGGKLEVKGCSPGSITTAVTTSLIAR